MNKRIVIKVGSSTLTMGTTALNRPQLERITAAVSLLHERGFAPVLVTSGAQAAGRETLIDVELGRYIPRRQMLCAVGQPRLMQIYQELFSKHQIRVAQILLTRRDLSNRRSYLNARDTFEALIEERVVPIVNENDTVATEEIRFGDNDSLSARVAALCSAERLCILTDQNGLYTADPRRDGNARLIEEVPVISPEIEAAAGGVGSALGSGGMRTKIEAAKIAAAAGIATVIMSGSRPEALLEVVQGAKVGTLFLPTNSEPESRKRWLLAERPNATIVLDGGAQAALLERGASLLAAGVAAAEGVFQRGDVVALRSSDGRTLGQGITAYDSEELLSIKGLPSARYAEILGYTRGDVVVHRNNLVLY